MANNFVSEFGLRVISAIILAPAVIASVYFGGFVLAVTAWAIGACALKEWGAMFTHYYYDDSPAAAKADDINIAQSEIYYHVSFALAALTNYLNYIWATMAILLMAIIVLPLTKILMRGARFKLNNYYRHMGLGLCIAAITAIGLPALRGDTVGLCSLIIFTLIVVWVSDTFAYFAGKILKGPKLAPAISPGKTWSGCLGGVTAAAIIGVCYQYNCSLPDIKPAIVVAIVMAIAAIIGDLLESYAKRRFAVKDSGSLIPGHGGVLDRIDGLSAAIIIALLVKFVV